MRKKTKRIKAGRIKAGALQEALLHAMHVRKPDISQTRKRVHF